MLSNPNHYIPPGDIFMCADVVYEDAPVSHAKAKLAVINEEFFALLFPVDDPYKSILKRDERDRDPSEKFLLDKYLRSPLQDHVHLPILSIIGESFDEPEIIDNWQVMIGYTTPKVDTDPSYRALLLYPSNSQRPNAEYVLPYMRVVKRDGLQNIYLEAGCED